MELLKKVKCSEKLPETGTTQYTNLGEREFTSDGWKLLSKDKEVGEKVEYWYEQIDLSELTFKYKNWKGEISDRKVLPITVWFGSTEYHKEPQLFLKAFDVDKQVERDFALKDIQYYELSELHSEKILPVKERISEQKLYKLNAQLHKQDLTGENKQLLMYHKALEAAEIKVALLEEQNWVLKQIINDYKQDDAGKYNKVIKDTKDNNIFYQL
jgi:hypothetical protein